jgi:hypothetical protein
MVKKSVKTAKKAASAKKAAKKTTSAKKVTKSRKGPSHVDELRLAAKASAIRRLTK